MPTAPIQLLPVGYYDDLLTSEYSQAQKFHSWLLVVLNIANDISNCLSGISGAFDIDTAIGVQLDILGQIIGVSRTVPFQPSGGVSPILTDAVYRTLLYATIANNQWDGKIGSLYPIWRKLFPGGTIVINDNQNMTATIFLTGSFTSIIQDLITHDMIIPRPQTVAYTYEIGTLPFFGFDRNDSFIAGFDIGKWA
jgi:uncharacterized protein DUF2612